MLLHFVRKEKTVKCTIYKPSIFLPPPLTPKSKAKSKSSPPSKPSKSKLTSHSKKQGLTLIPHEDFDIEETSEPLDSKMDYILHFQKKKLAHGIVVTSFGVLL